jgi:glycosyltransferase involved in cell wall biosynthesis
LDPKSAEIPFVTVLIPAYNAAATIRRAIDSVFAQHYPSLEIVVVDDGSHDATSEVVAGYNRKEIRLLRLPRNHGEGGVLNKGLMIAKGDYIAFLDADDEWLPTKLTKQIELIESNPNATMVSCGCLFADHTGSFVEEFGVPPPGIAKSEVWRLLLVAAFIAKPCVVARAGALAGVGPFDTTIPISADQDMWIRLAMAGEVEFLPEYLTRAYDTPGSLTKAHLKEMHRATLPMVHRHLQKRREDLSREEIQYILRERYSNVGRNLYTGGRFFRGLLLLLQSIWWGARFQETLRYLIMASPAVRRAKRLWRQQPRALASPARRRGPTLLMPAIGDLVAPTQLPPILVATVNLASNPAFDGGLQPHYLSVDSICDQLLLQDVCDRFGVRPTYFVGYGAATHPEGCERLRQIARSGRCEIGTYLQPSETPPLEEELTERTLYAQNLPAWLQKEKLARLTEQIVSNLGVRPYIHRTDGHGVGEDIVWILEALGYLIDMSALPGIDMRRQHGPDFSQTPDAPYWVRQDGSNSVLEIPTTAAFMGPLSEPRLPEALSRHLYELLSRQKITRAAGLFSGLGLLRWAPLTLERRFAELRRLTLTLLSRGRRVFVLTDHSSPLLPAALRNLQSPKEYSSHLATIEAYLRFFFDEIGGISMTPLEFRSKLLESGAGTAISHFGFKGV